MNKLDMTKMKKAVTGLSTLPFQSITIGQGWSHSITLAPCTFLNGTAYIPFFCDFGHLDSLLFDNKSNELLFYIEMDFTYPGKMYCYLHCQFQYNNNKYNVSHDLSLFDRNDTKMHLLNQSYKIDDYSNFRTPLAAANSIYNFLSDIKFIERIEKTQSMIEQFISNYNNCKNLQDVYTNKDDYEFIKTLFKILIRIIAK